MATVTPIDAKRSANLLDDFQKTDSGNAERLIALCGRDLRYVRTWNKWIGWNGKRWAIDDGAPHRAAKAVARELWKIAQRAQDPEKRSTAIKYALRCESKGSIEAAVSLARHDLAVAITHEDLDVDPWLLNVRNGTIDLKTGNLREHRREDLLTKLAPVDYDATATCARFEQFMREIMAGDEELVTFLHRFLGYSLTGDVREHVLTFWHGDGGNGKSVLAGIVLYVLGTYAGKAAPDLLFRSEYSDRHPTEVADLVGLRLVIANETTRGRSWDEGTLKDLTGGDKQKARRMREDFWEFLPTHKLVVFGQYKPHIKQANDAMRRRLRLVPFAVSFVGREDKGLPEILKSEAPGVLRWLVQGCLDWQRDGIPEATAVRKATGAYFRDEDTIGQFFEAHTIFEPTARITRKELREQYVRWAQERDERPTGAKAFTDAVRQRGGRETSVRTPAGPRDGWQGVRLATDPEREKAGGQATCSPVVMSSEEFPVQHDPDVLGSAKGDPLNTDHYGNTDEDEPGIFDDLIGGGG